MIARLSKLSPFWLLAVLPLIDLSAQIPRSTVRPSNTRLPPNMRMRPPVATNLARPMKPASELIYRQDPMNVTARLLDKATPDNTHVRVSLSKQRAYLLLGDEVVIDTPISSGKKSRITPSGSFHVQEKDKDHRSNIYGNFVDSSGRVVRAGVSSKIDSAPSGTHFVGAPMTWFMRLTDEGVGMHVGILPGYPASHGCIRMPPQAAEMFYNRVRIGTSVVVGD